MSTVRRAGRVNWSRRNTECDRRQHNHKEKAVGSTIAPPSPADNISQRHLALKEANRVRTARAALLRRMGEKRLPESCWMASELVEDTPEVLESMGVLDFLLRVRQVGPSVADRLLRVAQVGPHVELRGLTLRQRSRLAAALQMRCEVSQVFAGRPVEDAASRA